MSDNDILDIFRSVGAFRSGHFLLASGLHSEAYVQCARILEHPRTVLPLAARLAAPWKDATVDAVLGPAYGGILVAFALADALGVRAMYAERVQGALTIRRGFEAGAGSKILVAEDVVTTGESALETVELLKKAGATVVGVASLVDRTGGRNPFGVPFHALLKVDLPTHDPAACPLCARKVPLETPGQKQLAAQGRA